MKFKPDWQISLFWILAYAIAGFENGKIKFTFGFLNDGRQIKGVFPEAVE